MNFLRAYLDCVKERQRLRDVAIAAYFLRHPIDRILGGACRAREPDRLVFAIFYERPPFRAMPSLYRLFAVDRQSLRVEELKASAASPYRILNRK